MRTSADVQCMDVPLRMPPFRRARVVSIAAGGVVLMHLGHLLVLLLAGWPGDPSSVALSGAVWVLVLAWSLLRGARLNPVEVAVCCSLGAVAISVDAIFSQAPAGAIVCTVGLVGLSSAIGVLASPRALVAVGPLMGVCQVSIVLATQGLDLLAVYAALSVVSTTAGTCVVIWWAERGRHGALRALAHAAVADPLTGLLNRRGMTEGFAVLRRAAPTGTRIGVVALDLDHFKAVNDALGHHGGDQVLVAVAQVLGSRARSGDLVVRLGGEEFAWFGAWHTGSDVHAAAERLRETIAATVMPHGVLVTISAGVALSADAGPASPDVEALSELLLRADTALYRAKAAGRDRVEVAATPDAGAPAPRVRDGGSSSPVGSVDQVAQRA